MGSLVTASTRTVYTATICGVTRKFFTLGAAYYAVAKSLIGRKYLSAITLEDAGAATDADRVRADRARALFFDGEAFDAKRWTAYVRRVARRLRALDDHRAKEARRG